MRVNTRVRYGLRAILQIAENYGNGPTSVSVIAESQEISNKYLEQVVGSLRKAGFIESIKGMRGGYNLARDPQDINLWEIITALDSHSTLVECVDDPASCDRNEDCMTRNIWSLLTASLKEFWSGITLTELLKAVNQDQQNRLQELVTGDPVTDKADNKDDENKS